MSNGKGSGQRPTLVPQQEFNENWDRIFSRNHSAETEYMLSGEDIVAHSTDLSYHEFQKMAADYEEELAKEFKEISTLDAEEGEG
jgi:hypothetical protein